MSRHAGPANPWAVSAPCDIAHEALDDTVLQRVEADHDQTRALRQYLQRAFQAPLQIIQLAVDEDADRLKSACRRMLALFP